MCLALELAWTFIQRSQRVKDREADDARETVAREVLIAAQLGATSKAELANFAIRRYRIRTDERYGSRCARGLTAQRSRHAP
jgi:hypothetical protein